MVFIFTLVIVNFAHKRHQSCLEMTTDSIQTFLNLFSGDKCCLMLEFKT